MSTITFKNGKSFTVNTVYGTKEIYQASERDVLEIVIPADEIALDEAKKLWQNTDATSEITIVYDEISDGGIATKAGVHVNYTLPVSLTLNQLDGTDVIRMRLAQKSALEIMQEKQAQDMDDVNAALCELAEIVAGGDE